MNNNSRSRLNLPFEFEEVILSSKERARILKFRNPFEFNPFGDDSNTLTVTEFRLCALSARLRTINNARETNVVLPDGSPLTEVTMYGRKGEVYLLGSFEAVKHVIAGEAPSNFKVILKIEAKQKMIKARINGLTQCLNRLYTDKQATSIFHMGMEFKVGIGHGPTIEKAIALNSAMIDQLQLFRKEVEEWKWWGSFSSLEKDISKRIDDAIENTDAAFGNIVKRLASRPELADTQIDELRFLGQAIPKSMSELNALLKMLIPGRRVTNIHVFGTLTQLLPRDVAYIDSALTDLERISSDVQQLERDVKSSQEASKPRADQHTLSTRTIEIYENYDETVSRLKEQILS